MGEIYKEYQVTDGDIRFKVCVTAMKWCDEQLQHLAKKREAIKKIPDKINGQPVSSKDELLKLQQYRQSLLEEVDKEELQIECLRIPTEASYNTPLDTFREHLKEPLLTGVSMRLMASQGSEALIHSSEYERAASEPTQKIWNSEFIKQHSENAYFGLHGSDTEKIKAYMILLKTNEWLRDAQLKPYQPQQTAPPAGDQTPKKYTKTNTVKEVVNLFFDNHVGDDNSIFAVLEVGKGKGTRQEELPTLWELFKNEHPEWIKDKDKPESKGIGSRDSFYTYLNNWRKLQKEATEN
jgi:hypothetical protein